MGFFSKFRIGRIALAFTTGGLSEVARSGIAISKGDIKEGLATADIGATSPLTVAATQQFGPDKVLIAKGAAPGGSRNRTGAGAAGARAPRPGRRRGPAPAPDPEVKHECFWFRSIAPANFRATGVPRLRRLSECERAGSLARRRSGPRGLAARGLFSAGSADQEPGRAGELAAIGRRTIADGGSDR